MTLYPLPFCDLNKSIRILINIFLQNGIALLEFSNLCSVNHVLKPIEHSLCIKSALRQRKLRSISTYKIIKDENAYRK